MTVFSLELNSVLIGARIWYQMNVELDLHDTHTRKRVPEKLSWIVVSVSGVCVMGLMLVTYHVDIQLAVSRGIWPVPYSVLFITLQHY